MASYAFDDFRFPSRRPATREPRPVPRAPRRSSVLDLTEQQAALAAQRAAARALVRDELQRPSPKPQPAPRPAESAHADHPAEVRLVPPQATPGFVALPGTGRLVWWTGRVAIGLRYQAPAPSADSEMGKSAEWIQSMLLH